jgi:hypothetical protein
MKRLALVGFPDGLARQDIAPMKGWGDDRLHPHYLVN